jgi:hypothetical protein
MTAAEIVDSLYPNSPSLREAIDEAVRRKDELIPALLESLQDALDDIDGAIETDHCVFIAAAYLLAQFREKAAFPLLIKLIEFDEETVRDLWGDILTESYHRMLRDTFNGDTGALRGLIENRRCSPWARRMALDAYGFIFHDGHITRRELTRYLRRLIRVVYREDLDEDDITVVTAIGNIVIDYHLFEMTEDIKELYDNEFIDLMDYGEYDEFLKLVNGFYDTSFDDRHITDTAEELRFWFDK